MDRSCLLWWLAAPLLALPVACLSEGTIGDDDVAPDDDDTVVVDDDDTVEDDDDTVVVDDDDVRPDVDPSDITYIFDGDDDCAAPDDDDAVDDDDVIGPVFDCATAPATVGTETVIPNARGYHGLAIDSAGLIVGSDGWSLVQCDYVGNWSVWMPNIGAVEQMAYLPGGHLVYASVDSGGIHRISPSGGQSVVATGLNAYGVIYGPDGNIWTAGWNNTVDRIDPASGQVTNIATIPGNTPHSIAFNLDYTVLYIGTVGDGTVYQQALDASLNPVGPPSPWTNVGSGWHDAIAVDICGYLYIPDYWSTSMWRVNPTTGAVNLFADWNSSYGWYAHGAIWGTGVGGWLEDALYVPMPYSNNQVREVYVGVPGRDWSGTAINPP